MTTKITGTRIKTMDNIAQDILYIIIYNYNYRDDSAKRKRKTSKLLSLSKKCLALPSILVYNLIMLSNSMMDH